MKVHKAKKMVFKTLLSALMILAVSGVALGQKNLKPGYIITIAGDKVNGYIDYRDWEKNPKSIIFKETPANQNIIYTPLQIKRFAVENKIYESAIVNVDQAPYTTQNLTYTQELNYRTDTIFLEALYQGEKSLYYYKDQEGKESFFIGQNSKFELLIFKKYLLDTALITSIGTNNEYKRQLSSYLTNCPSVIYKLNNLEYSDKGLSDLFSDYYKNCTASPAQFKKKAEKTSVETGIIAGVSYSSLKFEFDDNNSFDYLTKGDFSKAANFAGGLFLNVILPRNQGKWSIANELLFAPYKVTGVYNEYHNSDYYIINKTTFGYPQIKLINMLRYKFPGNKIFFYLNAGITNAFAVAETNKDEKEIHQYSPSTFEEDKGLAGARKYEQGLILGLGSQFEKYSIDIRMEKGNGVSKISALNSGTTRLYLLLRYRF